jgi:hypothetical protein
MVLVLVRENLRSIMGYAGGQVAMSAVNVCRDQLSADALHQFQTSVSPHRW